MFSGNVLRNAVFNVLLPKKRREGVIVKKPFIG
jgi:hypothetical protein